MYSNCLTTFFEKYENVISITTALKSIPAICVEIKQNESEVGTNILLVSEVLFYLNTLYYVNINVKTKPLSQVQQVYVFAITLI